MAQKSRDLIEAMRAIAEAAQPITGRGVGYKLFTQGLTESMSRHICELKVGREGVGRAEGGLSATGTRGRKRSYYERLVAQIHDEEAKLVAHLGSIVYDLNRRLRGPSGRRKRHDPTKATPRSDPASS